LIGSIAVIARRFPIVSLDIAAADLDLDPRVVDLAGQAKRLEEKLRAEHVLCDEPTGRAGDVVELPEQILDVEAIPAPSLSETLKNGSSGNPLSGVRDQLASVIEALAVGSAELAEKHRPIQNLQPCIADADLARADHAATKADHDAVLNAYLAEGAPPPRPEPSKSLLCGEQRLVETQADAAAARAARADVIGNRPGTVTHREIA
jgi:hypothetical protein